jgi:hypothetical protein
MTATHSTVRFNGYRLSKFVNIAQFITGSIPRAAQWCQEMHLMPRIPS